MKKQSTLLFFIQIFFLTLYAQEHTQERFEIPFFVNSQGNIYVELIDGDYQYKFLFDTASNINVLYNTGYKKAQKNLGYDVEEELFKLVRENNVILSDDDIRVYVHEYINEQGASFVMEHFNCSGNDFFKKDFVYAPKEYNRLDDSDFDGMIGLCFFDSPTNVLIDYKNNMIVVNGNLLNAKPVPMNRLEVTGIYTIEIKINGISQDALIDTGSMLFFLRPEYKSDKRYKESELRNFLDENMPEYKNNGKTEIGVNLQIGSFKEKVTGHFFSSEKYGSTADGAAFVKKINILGNQIYMNHKIQLDFENMEFRIE